MPDILGWLRKIVSGFSKLPGIEEESYPRDAQGRPDLGRFTRPAAHYIGYIEEYLTSLTPSGPAELDLQRYAYRKGVIGQWGIIARGPSEGLPYVLRLLKHPVPEGRSAAAGILDAWAVDASLVPQLVASLETETDIEALSTVAGTLGRLKAAEALPRLAALLRSPSSTEGDLLWSVIEAVSAIVGKRFVSAAEPQQAADRWLREHGY
jgi:hypothetical protein